MTITFYDIPSSLAINAWSPNTWKTRYCLNYKGIPYKTEWVEYPDIEAHCIKLGIAGTGTKADGSAMYTLPAIHDPSTGKYISDSVVIAEYLEKQYPNTPSLFPHGTEGLQNAFAEAYANQLEPLWQFILPATCLKLNPPSEAYFRRTREQSFGKKLEDLVPKGQAWAEEWAKVQDGLGKVDAWLSKDSGGQRKGPFVLGDTISWGDLVIASYTIWLKIVWGENSKEWKDISGWHGGRWVKLVDALGKYETVR
ncbi:hypothetical protein B0H34DRAFT_706156 [Crassisporium funariophilum]|nr:hypothetical protein B0H34DRAFT_706156 [Crassisporium funariophilum]